MGTADAAVIQDVSDGAQGCLILTGSPLRHTHSVEDYLCLLV